MKRRSEAGIDIIADGEMGRVGFIPYVNERLQGITPSATAESADYGRQSREYRAFPEFYARASGMPDTAGADRPHQRVRHEEAFMPAVSPANLANWNRNEHYKSEEEYLYALAEAPLTHRP